VIAADGQLYLDSYLAPISRWLAREDVTDIYINRPGEIWVESLGGPIERHDAAVLDAATLNRLARQIAAANAQGVNREHPLLAASLPDGSRVQVVLPPATRGDVAIAIRRHVVQELRLESYRETICTDPRVVPGGSDDWQARIASDPIAALRDAVRERRTILVSGGTSSGKTTFLNALLREVPEDERLITIEDAGELQIRQPNTVGLIAARGSQGEAEVTAEDLLIAALRMRPDRIILGEIRGAEAMTFLRAINTGHPGSLSTIHADSPEGAIDQLALLAMQAGGKLTWDDLVRYITKSIDIIVQLARSGGRRKITAIKFAPAFA